MKQPQQNLVKSQPSQGQVTKHQEQQQKATFSPTKQDEDYLHQILAIDQKLEKLETSFKEYVKAQKKAVYEDQLKQEDTINNNLDTLSLQFDLYREDQNKNQESPNHKKIQSLLALGEKILYNLDLSKFLKGNQLQLQNPEVISQDDINKPQQIQINQSESGGFLEQSILDHKKKIDQLEETIKSNFSQIQKFNETLNKHNEAIQQLEMKQQTTLNQIVDFEKKFKSPEVNANNDVQKKIDEMGQKLEQLLSENQKVYVEQENKIEIIVGNMESKLKQLISDKLTEQGSKNKTKIDEMALKFNQLLSENQNAQKEQENKIQIKVDDMQMKLKQSTSELQKTQLEIESKTQTKIDELGLKFNQLHSENQKDQENKTQLRINDLESKFKALLSDNLKIGLKELEKKVQQQIDDIKLQFDQFLKDNQQIQNVIQKFNDQLKSKGSLQQQTTNNSKTNQTDLNDLEITLVQFISKQEDLNNKQQSFVQNLLDRISQIETKELQEIEAAFGLIFGRLNNIENTINHQQLNQVYDQLQEGLFQIEAKKDDINKKFLAQDEEQRKSFNKIIVEFEQMKIDFIQLQNEENKNFNKIIEEFEQIKVGFTQQQNEQNKSLVRLTRNVNQIQYEMNISAEQVHATDIGQSQQIIEFKNFSYQQEHPDLQRLKVVQEKINQLYNQSCRRRSAVGRYQLFIKEKQSLQELQRNYGIRSSEQKRLLTKVCNCFRQARGDGNCFYTAFGFQFLSIILNVYGDNEFQQFISKMDNLITFKISHGQGYQIQDSQLQKQLWEEFKYRLNFLKNMKDPEFRLEELVLNFSAYEQSPDYPLIDGCFYALSTIFFRNLANYVIDNSEMKQQVFDQYNLLIWEEECNSNEIVIQELSKFLQIHIKLLFFDNGTFQLREYSEGMQHQIILLIQPGHYNVGLLEKQEVQQ